MFLGILADSTNINRKKSKNADQIIDTLLQPACACPHLPLMTALQEDNLCLSFILKQCKDHVTRCVQLISSYLK